MKIAWVCDFTLGVDLGKQKVQGGAEITDNLVIKEGKKRGHKIEFILPNEFTERETVKLKGYDLAVLSNIFYHKVERIKWISDNLPFIRYEHDACFCLYRNPMCEQNCLNRGIPKCDPPLHHTLFKKAKLNVFLSPLQLKLHLGWFKGDIGDNYVLIPPPLIKGKFSPPKDRESQKNGRYLFVGLLAPAKGIKEIIQDFYKTPDKVDFVGMLAHTNQSLQLYRMIKSAGFNYLGERDHSELPKLFREYQYSLQYQNRYYEAHGRTIIEAMASGCEIVAKDKEKIGALSWNIPNEELLEKCYNAPKDFWDNVEKKVSKVSEDESYGQNKK